MFCVLEKVDINLDLDLEAEYTEKNAISRLSIKLVATAKTKQKNVLLFEDKQIFLFFA